MMNKLLIIIAIFWTVDLLAAGHGALQPATVERLGVSNLASVLEENPAPAVKPPELASAPPGVAPAPAASPPSMMATTPAPAEHLDAKGAIASSHDKPPTEPLTLLQGCWTNAQLRATTEDQKTKKIVSAPLLSGDAQSPITSLPAAWKGSIRAVKPRNGEKVVALTFDLCEGANETSVYDAALINYLRDQQVKATFFATGKWMQSHPERTMQLMADSRFELGNHTWTHANLRVTNPAKFYEQITKTQTEYTLLRESFLQSACGRAVGDKAAEHIPSRLSMFRFPYGACNAQALAAVNQAGLAAIQWNIVTGDPTKGQSAPRIAHAVLDQIRPGSIIIAHANGRGWHTAEALPLIIPELRARGYRFVTVSELLAQGEIVTVDSCYEMQPGDNLKYDHWSRMRRKP